MERNATWKRRLGHVLRIMFLVATLAVLSRQVSWQDRVRLATDPEHPVPAVQLADGSWETIDPVRRVAPDALATQDQVAPHQAPVEPGLQSSLVDMDRRWVLLGVSLYFPAIFIIVQRLTALLKGFATEVPYRRVLQLTFTGNLLNYVMPGGNGGDLYKGVMLARLSPGRGVEAVTVLLLDRVIGLFSFLTVALVAILLSWKESMGPVGRTLGVLITCIIVGVFCYTSPTVRRLLRWESWMTRIPWAQQVARIDATVLELRAHPGATVRAFAASAVAQMFAAGTVTCLLFAFGGDEARGPVAGAIAATLAFTVGTVISAVPITFQGFGLVEAVYYQVLVTEGFCSVSEMLAITMGLRITGALCSLPGLVGAFGRMQTPAPAVETGGTPPRGG